MFQHATLLLLDWYELSIIKYIPLKYVGGFPMKGIIIHTNNFQINPFEHYSYNYCTMTVTIYI